MTDTLLIACPKCSTLNRFPRAKLDVGSAGKCGQCSAPLFDGHPVALASGNFDAHAGKAELPLLVDFWAPWCGPCRMMAPEFAKAAALAAGEAIFAKVNTDEQQQIALQFRIQGIPAFALLRNGQLAAQTSGFQPAARLLDWMRAS
jgi:thioredoxin 2